MEPDAAREEQHADPRHDDVEGNEQIECAVEWENEVEQVCRVKERIRGVGNKRASAAEPRCPEWQSTDRCLVPNPSVSQHWVVPHSEVAQENRKRGLAERRGSASRTEATTTTSNAHTQRS